MSCNGCRVLRRGCTDDCILRPCLEWIPTSHAQGNATLFISKFFGRSDLMSFISAVPENKRPALFQSLLFEACGRTVNPVSGAVGLLSTGNWSLCLAAVDTALAGGVIQPVIIPPVNCGQVEETLEMRLRAMQGLIGESSRSRNCNTASFGSGISEMSPELGKGKGKVESGSSGVGNKRPRLLNLFAK